MSKVVIADHLLQKSFETPVLLWHVGYYDIVLNGVALYQGKAVWVEHYDISEDDDYEIEDGYYLFELTEEHYRLLETYQMEFAEMVGFHTFNINSMYKPYDPQTSKGIYSLRSAWTELKPQLTQQSSFIMAIPYNQLYEERQ